LLDANENCQICTGLQKADVSGILALKTEVILNTFHGFLWGRQQLCTQVKLISIFSLL